MIMQNTFLWMWNNIQPQPSLLHHLKYSNHIQSMDGCKKNFKPIVRLIHHNKIIDYESFLHFGCYQSYKLQTVNNFKNSKPWNNFTESQNSLTKHHDC